MDLLKLTALDIYWLWTKLRCVVLYYRCKLLNLLHKLHVHMYVNALLVRWFYSAAYAVAKMNRKNKSKKKNKNPKQNRLRTQQLVRWIYKMRYKYISISKYGMHFCASAFIQHITSHQVAHFRTHALHRKNWLSINLVLHIMREAFFAYITFCRWIGRMSSVENLTLFKEKYEGFVDFSFSSQLKPNHRCTSQSFQKF